MKPRNIFKKEAFEVLQTKYPSLTPADIETADTELDNLYDEELTKEAKAIPEWSMFEDYSNGAQTIPEWSAVQEAPSALLKAGYQTAKTVVRDIPETALEFGQGMAGLGVDVASGLAQLPTGLVSPEAAKGIKKIGQGIKKEIGIESEQPEYTNDKEIKESQELQKQVEQYGKENPTWFSNFKKAIKEQPGSEELLSSAEGLKNFFQKSLENVADVASITATGKPVYNEQITEEMEKRPVKFWAETLLPVAGAGKMIKGKGKTITKETPETIPGYELKEGMPQEVPATEAISKYRQGSVEQLPPIKEIVGGEGEIAKDVIAEQQAQATDKAFKEQANTLAAKTEVRMLEEQMKENASRAARQAELEQGLGQTSIYDMLMQEAERRQQAKATEATLPEVGLSAEELAQTAPTLSIRDILQRGQTERGLKQPKIIDEQTGRIIKPTTTPEEMLANPLLRYENFPEFGIETIDYKKSAENILSKATEQPLLLTNGQNIATILPSVKEKGKFQFTAFDERGPIRDITKNNKQELIEEALHDGYENLATQEQFENLTKKTSFLDFMKTKKNIEEKIQPEINVKEGFNKYLETLDTKNKAKVTNQIKPKINELQYLANNNERIEIIYDESGKENYRVSNGNLQTKINKTEYNILKEAGMKTIEPEQPLISKDWENMSTDKLKQYPISELEKIVSDKRIQYNKRVDLNLKLQEIKQNQLQPQQQPLVEPEQANIPTIEQPAIGGAKNNIFKVKLEDIDIEPKRFQFKSNVNKEGVTDLYKGQKFEESYAGVSTIWLDPKDGRYKMIDGHHRYNMAKESKHPFLNVQLANDFGVETEAQARIFGAFKNIADDRGTPFDAAKIMRELNLKKLSDFEGLDIKVNPRQKTFSQGFKLAKLSDLAWEGVRNNVITENIGALLSDLNETQQNSVFKQIASYKDKYGVLPEPDKISSLIDNVKTMDVTPTQEYDMFGNVVETQPVWERAGLVSSILNELKQRKRIDKISTNEKISNRLEEKGTGKLNKEVGEQELANTLTTIDMFNKLKDVKGNIADKLNEGARRIAAGESETKIKKEVLDDVERTILDEYSKYYKTSPRVQSEPTGAGETIDIFGSTEKITPEQPSLTNFIKSEEGFINPQKVFDFLFKNKKEPNPIETEPALKSYNEDMQKGYDLEVEGLQKRTQTAEALKPSWFTKMITEYVKKEYPITRLEAKAKKAGANIPPEKSPTLLASDFTYLPTTIQGYLYSVNPDALKVDSNTMGKIMQMKRIVSERKDIANRYTPVEAQQYLDYIKNNLPEEYTKYENAIQTFRNNRNEFVIPELKRSRLFPKDLIDYIRDNENYSTNRVVKYLEEQRTGNRATGAVAKIFEQTGSTEQIGNPYKATILKDMALMTAARLNNYKLSSVDFLLQHFPNLIEKAKPKFIGWREKRIVGQPRKSTDKPITEYQKPKQSAFDTVFVKRDGKTEAYYTPKNIVDALNMESDIIPQWAQNLNSVNNMFKSAWIRYNYKFWLPAFAKDVTDTELFMPTGKGKATYTKELIPAIFKAIKSVYAVDAINDPAIREYYKSGIFIPEKRSAAYSNLSLEPFERQLGSYDINLEGNQPKSFLNKMTEPFKYVANKYAETGSVLERANKISAYEALKTVKINGKILSPEEVRHYARQLGSPAFLAGGKQTKTLQAILPFINPMVQGLDAAKSLAKLDPIGTAASFSALGALSAFGVAATMGYFGKEMQDQYKNITQTERDNFFSVPFTNIKVPLGFMFKPINKLINAFANDNENTFKDYLIASFSNTILQELPTFTPAFSVMQDASNILNGQRIYDDYRGFYAIPNADIEQAQNRETAINYMKYFWNNYGGGSFYKFGQEQQNYAPWQRFMRSPEEAERGEKQRVYKAAEPMKVKEARMRLASQHKARGEEYDTTENIIPGEIVKTKIQDALKKRKLSPEARARIMVIQERNPIIKKELINKFKKEGLW